MMRASRYPCIGAANSRNDRHRLNGYLAQLVPSMCLASSFRTCLNCKVFMVYQPTLGGVRHHHAKQSPSPTGGSEKEDPTNTSHLLSYLLNLLLFPGSPFSDPPPGDGEMNKCIEFAARRSASSPLRECLNSTS